MNDDNKKPKDQTEEEKNEAADAADQTAPDEAPSQDVEETIEKPAKTQTPTAGRWYIVHTYSGHENKVAKSIKQRVASLGFEDRIFDIIVPTRNTIKVSQGKKETVKEKIFPGYVLIRMILDDESWLL